MPEDCAGEVPASDPLTECDNPDEWRDVCDDPVLWGEDDG